jgi:hypothetical protein
VPRKTPAPGGGELHKRHYDVMHPFVTLTTAACATKKLKIGTGIALLIQRDTIQTDDTSIPAKCSMAILR